MWRFLENLRTICETIIYMVMNRAVCHQLKLWLAEHHEWCMQTAIRHCLLLTFVHVCCALFNDKSQWAMSHLWLYYSYVDGKWSCTVLGHSEHLTHNWINVGRVNRVWNQQFLKQERSNFYSYRSAPRPKCKVCSKHWRFHSTIQVSHLCGGILLVHYILPPTSTHWNDLQV